jgi:hypothetical protein
VHLDASPTPSSWAYIRDGTDSTYKSARADMLAEAREPSLARRHGRIHGARAWRKTRRVGPSPPSPTSEESRRDALSTPHRTPPKLSARAG